MSGPGGNGNDFPPYSQNIKQYPSQTSRYDTQNTFNQRGNHTPNRPHFYQNNAPPRQNFGFFEDRAGTSSNPPHFFRNNAPPQQQQHYHQPQQYHQQQPPQHYHQHQRNFFSRGGRGRGGGGRGRGSHQHHNPKADTYSQYFHTSMVEDPWLELMERHNAIHGQE